MGTRISKAIDRAQSLRVSLFSGRLAYGNSLGLLLGAASALLCLSNNVLTPWWAAAVFSSALLLTLALYLAFEAYELPWGSVSAVLLGFALGTIVYQYRHWFKWLWTQLRRINEAHEIVIAALFLIGIMLGAFVVRNWSKDQKAFIESLTAVFAGTFAAGIMAKLFENTPGMSQRTFALYVLGFALSGTVNLIFAAWLTSRYTNTRSIVSRAVLDFMYGPERAEAIDKYFLRNFEEDPDYAKRWLVTALSRFRDLVKEGFAERVKRKSEWHYYELVSIENDKNQEAELDEKKERKYQVRYKAVGRTLSPDSFRVGISIKNADLLEYIVAPGEYKAAFPSAGSVLGLSLAMRKTIVMDRDRNRKFRNKDHRDGIAPGEIEQRRGLDEIDYLSYISVPIVSRVGEATENALGVLNIDTKIFVSRDELKGKPDEGDEDIFSKRMTVDDLTQMASDLYDEEDKAIQYLESRREVIRPILELYARCRVGAA